jgi:hypothetical protein
LFVASVFIHDLRSGDDATDYHLIRDEAEIRSNNRQILYRHTYDARQEQRRVHKEGETTMSSAKAVQLKEEGNKYFQAGDYIGAEGLYSKA